MTAIRIVWASITSIEADVIVNAANTSLLGGGGVDGAIHRAAGPELLAECRQLGGCKLGEVKVSRAYKLPARYVFHTVGPVWQGGSHGEPDLLASYYAGCFLHAERLAVGSLVFPAISCGRYRYPHDAAASIAVAAFLKAQAERSRDLEITVAVTDESVETAYQTAIQRMNPAER